MKITWIVNNINQVGGIEQVVCGLSSYFCDQLGFQVEIVSINTERSQIFFPLSDLVVVRHYKLDWRTQTRKKLCQVVREIMKKLDSDFVVTCHPFISNAVLLNKRVYKGKIIVTEHTTYSYYSKKRIIANTIMFRFADRFLVLNESDRLYYEKTGCKAMVMPNAIFNPAQNLSNLDQKILLSAGRLEQVKGYDRLLQAFAIASQTYPEWKLCICGEGSQREALEKQAAELRIESRVLFPGFVKNMPDYYLKSSAFALSSHYEGFGLTLVDALAHGLPVVSFDLPAVREICGEKAALLAPQDDIDTFAAQLSTLFASDSLRFTMGQRAYERSLDYSLPAIAQRWMELFLALKES